MGYRETFFNNTTSFCGKYQCKHCKGWFSKSDIEVDHVIAKRLGGTDDLYNLQALCVHCNRSKRERSSSQEIAQTVIKAGLSGGANDLLNLGKSVAGQKLKDALGIKYKRK